MRDIDLPCPQQCLFILAITQSGHQLHAPSIWVDGGSRWTKHSFPHITVALSSARKWKQPSKRRCWRGINQPVAAGCVNIGVCLVCVRVCVWSGWMMTATGQCRFYRVMHRWGQMVANGWNKLQCQWVYFSPSHPLCAFQLISIILLRNVYWQMDALCRFYSFVSLNKTYSSIHHCTFPVRKTQWSHCTSPPPPPAAETGKEARRRRRHTSCWCPSDY